MKLLLSCLAVIFFYSCTRCHKATCYENPIIKLNGIMPWEADTIWVIYHENPTDTLLTRSEMITRSANSKLVDPVDMHRDVTIIFPNISKQFVLTDFRYEQVACGEGCSMKQNAYTAFKGCKVNGQPKNAEIYLSKY